ncbi:MAG TPA: DUF2510 domain-containing protein [Acidimicrobiales bacterium]|nr:DUF2510 domain-containing protein [Acidimicrobiales bacterium]
MLWYGHGASWVFVVIVIAFFVARTVAVRRRGPGNRQGGPGPYGGPSRGPYGGGPYGGPYGRGPYGGGPGMPTATSTGSTGSSPAGSGSTRPASTPSGDAGPGRTGAPAPAYGTTERATAAGNGNGSANGHTGVPAGWLVDPSGRHQQRYWSGTTWTEHVADDGVPGLDPPPGAPPA